MKCCLYIIKSVMTKIPANIVQAPGEQQVLPALTVFKPRPVRGYDAVLFYQQTRYHLEVIRNFLRWSNPSIFGQVGPQHSREFVTICYKMLQNVTKCYNMSQYLTLYQPVHGWDSQRNDPCSLALTGSQWTSVQERVRERHCTGLSRSSHITL